jgi:hypothetical protein
MLKFSGFADLTSCCAGGSLLELSKQHNKQMTPKVLSQVADARKQSKVLNVPLALKSQPWHAKTQEHAHEGHEPA